MFLASISSFVKLFVLFPWKRNSIVFSSGVNYLHSDLDISNQSKVHNNYC